MLELVKDTLTRPAGTAASGGDAGSAPVGLSPLLAEWRARKWTSCFNDAYDALVPRGTTTSRQLFWRGLSNFQNMRAALLRLGAPFASLRSGRVGTGDRVRIAQFDEDLTDADRRIFTQPIALAELGRYIVRLNRGRSQEEWNCIDQPVRCSCCSSPSLVVMPGVLLLQR